MSEADEWNWKAALVIACDMPGERWKAERFIAKLEEHKARYPAFMPERVAEMFLRESPKTRGWYCYQPISTFTKSIHKAASLRSLASNEHL